MKFRMIPIVAMVLFLLFIASSETVVNGDGGAPDIEMVFVEGGTFVMGCTPEQGSNDVNAVAWYTENSGFKTHPVGTKMPNELGIYDMSGNVWERTLDAFTRYGGSAQENPGGAVGQSHINRGGGWNANAGVDYSTRVSYRSANVPAFRSNRLGFRLVISSVMFSDDLPVVSQPIITPPVEKFTPASVVDSPNDMYYEISVPAELDAVRKNLSGRYKLTADISLASYGNWIPIGSYDDPFTGKLDGNGYKIKDLKINRSTEEIVGLFGCVKGGVIRNLALENVSIVGKSGVGGIAGLITEGTIIANSYSTGRVSAFGVFSGGWEHRTVSPARAEQSLLFSSCRAGSLRYILPPVPLRSTDGY